MNQLNHADVNRDLLHFQIGDVKEVEDYFLEMEEKK